MATNTETQPLAGDLLTIKEAAALLGLTPSALNVWYARGKGPNRLTLGRAVRYARADIGAWLLERRERGIAEQAARKASRAS